MESMITSDDRIAMAEVDYIINHMNERYIQKIPQNVLDFISILKKKDLEIYIDPKKPLQNQGLKEFTLYFLMILNLKYWCNDQRKKDILTMMENNQKKYEEKIYNMFDQAESIHTASEQVVENQELSKQKKITIVNNTSSQEQESLNENTQQELKDEKEVAITETPKEHFWTKLINKIKSFFVKKEV